MKEMLKNKYIILFIVLMLGITYINALGLRTQKNVSTRNTDNKSISKITYNKSVAQS